MFYVYAKRYGTVPYRTVMEKKLKKNSTVVYLDTYSGRYVEYIREYPKAIKCQPKNVFS